MLKGEKLPRSDRLRIPNLSVWTRVTQGKAIFEGGTISRRGAYKGRIRSERGEKGKRRTGRNFPKVRAILPMGGEAKNGFYSRDATSFQPRKRGRKVALIKQAPF